jgi:8-oxo-dGTP diphosphatase
VNQPNPPFMRPRVASGVLFLDEREQVLIVVPSYKDYLDIPGGYVEPGEGPRAAAQREVHEELGIEPPIGRLRSPTGGTTAPTA